MKRVLGLLLFVGVLLTFMGRPGPPGGRMPQGPMTHPMGQPGMGPQGPMCTLCHAPKNLYDLTKVSIPRTVSGYVIDQKANMIVIMNKMDVYHIRVPWTCNAFVLGYKVSVSGLEVMRGRGNTFNWHLVRASSCPQPYVEKQEVTNIKPLELKVVNRPECSTCHTRLYLSQERKVSYEAEVSGQLFYKKGDWAVLVSGNAFWHLKGCQVSGLSVTVRGKVVEEGSGMSNYYVLSCR